MPTGANHPLLRRPRVFERLRAIEFECPLEEGAGGAQVALEHALLRQPGAERIQWGDQETLSDTTQDPRLAAKAQGAGNRA